MLSKLMVTSILLFLRRKKRGYKLSHFGRKFWTLHAVCSLVTILFSSAQMRGRYDFYCQ